MSRLRLNLKSKVISVNMVVQILFLAILLYIFNKMSVSTFTVMKKQSTSAIIQGQARELEFAFSRPMHEVEELAKQEEIRSYLKSESKNNLENSFRTIESFMVGSGYSNVYLMDVDGNVRLSIDPSFLSNNFSYRDYFTKAMSGSSHMQIAFGTVTKKPGYYFSAPVKVEEKVVGVIVIKLETSYIENILKDSPTKTIGHYFLADENGVVISSDKAIEPYQSLGKLPSDKLQKIQQERRFEGFGLTPLQYQVAQDIIDNYTQPTSIEYQDTEDSEEGEEYESELIQVHRVGSYPFFLVTESSLESILGPITSMILPITLLLVGSVVFGLILQLLAYNKFFQPLSKIKQYTKDVADGKYADIIKINTGDEIESLSDSLAVMVITLQEAREKLQQKVEVKTSELNTNLMALEAKNLQMSKNEIAMLNILEDSKELEKQLAEEKESVEQKVVERTRELSDEQSRLMASISALPRAFIILDKENHILMHNGKLDDIFGKQDKDWEIDLIDSLLGDKIDLRAKLKTVYEKRENFDISDILYKTKYLRVFVAPVINKDGELLGSVMTIKDESEAKALSRSRDEFFSIASHELRTPLTAIRGNTSMIMNYYKETLKDKNFKEMIEDTHTAAIRLIEIVNDFLDMSRLEQGRMEYKKEFVDLVEITDKVVKDLLESASRKGVELKIEGESKAKTMIDPGKFEQIMFNLIGNSLKFTEKGFITISIKKDENEIKIQVKDTGSGIAPENQSLLFHKFQQAGKSTITRDGSKGTGLGLYISRLIAEGMGGRIELLSSQIGKGSIFGISLPIINEK